MPGVQHRVQRLERPRAGRREVDGRLRVGAGNVPEHPPARAGVPVRPLRGPGVREGVPERRPLQGGRVRRRARRPGQVRRLPEVLRCVPLRRAALRLRRAGHEDEQVHHVRRSPGRGHAARVHGELPAAGLRLRPVRRAGGEVRRRAVLRGHARARRHGSRLPRVEPAREAAACALRRRGGHRAQPPARRLGHALRGRRGPRLLRRGHRPPRRAAHEARWWSSCVRPATIWRRRAPGALWRGLPESGERKTNERGKLWNG